MNPAFKDRAKFLLDLLPYVLADPRVAIKGGTAINMFYRDLPRISVDIDLVYVPIKEREKTLTEIYEILAEISTVINRNRPSTVIVPKKSRDGRWTALTVEENGVVIKIESNTILRGSVFPVEKRLLSEAVAAALEYEGFLNVQMLPLPDLYGGKICAALDRQHPRDLFDIMVLFEHEGITPQIRKAFVVYLAGHDRPMHELLSPQWLDMRGIFDREFAGMTDRQVTWEELVEVRKRLIMEIRSSLSEAERKFLISMKQGEPEWDLLGLPEIERLPSLQWKLLNIRKMDRKKHSVMLMELKMVLEL